MHNPARPARTSHRARAAKVSHTGTGHRPAGGTLAYALVLAVIAAGLLLTWHGSRYAGKGTAVAGAALLGGGLARLVLPPRWAGLLACRSKAVDAVIYAVLGGGVLTLALVLP